MTNTFKAMMMAGVLGLSCLTGAYANTPSDRSVEEYIKLVKFDENFINDTKVGFISSFTSALMMDVDKNFPNLSSDKRAQILTLVEQEAKLSAEEFVSDKQLQAQNRVIIKQVISKHFNQAQIDALNDFYRTPIGQQVVDAQSAMIKEMMPSLLAIAAQKAQEMDKQPQIIKRLTALKETITKIAR